MSHLEDLWTKAINPYYFTPITDDPPPKHKFQDSINEAKSWLIDTGDYTPIGEFVTKIDPVTEELTPGICYHEYYGRRSYFMPQPVKYGSLDVGKEDQILKGPVLIGGPYYPTGVYLPIDADNKSIDWAAKFIKRFREKENKK